MLFYNYRIVWVPELPVILHFFPIESMLTDVFHSLAAAFLYHVKILTHAIKTELLFLIPRGLNVSVNESGVSLAQLTQHQTKMSVAHVVNEFDPPDTKSVSTQEAMRQPEQRLAVSGNVTFGWIKQISTLRKANEVTTNGT